MVEETTMADVHDPGFTKAMDESHARLEKRLANVRRRTSYKMWDDLYVELIHRTSEEMLEYIYSMLRSRRMFGTNTREGCARESLDQVLADRRKICQS